MSSLCSVCNSYPCPGCTSRYIDDVVRLKAELAASTRECTELRKDVSALKRTYMADLSGVAVETLDKLAASVRVEIVGGDDPLAVARLMVNGFGVASWPAHTEWRRTSENGHKYAEECARVLVKAVESLRPSKRLRPREG